MSDVGDLLVGRYRLKRLLGRGAMGLVWHATDERLNRDVAIKQLLPETGVDPVRVAEARERSLREARIAGRLQHPHAVAVHDVEVVGGLPVLVMEYVPSRSLADILAEEGTMDAASVAGIGAQAASALFAAHAAGIVHRDVKPGNILITDDGTAKITDFGISHAAGDVVVTQTGQFAGTPAYLAPEIARGEAPTSRSDVFSLGATLYTAVEGTPPFGEDVGNPIALLRLVAEGDVPPPRHTGPLAPVLTGMLVPDPAERLTLDQAGDALRAVASGRPLPVAVEQAVAAAARSSERVATSASTVGGLTSAGTLLDAQPTVATGEGDGPGGGRPAEVPAPRRRWVYLAAGFLATLLTAAVMLAALSSEPEPASEPERVAPHMTATAMEEAVSGYYRLLPDRPQEAWERLGPDLRAQGRDRYQNHWESVADVSVISPPRATAPETVHVGVEIAMPDGTKTREFRHLGMMVAEPRPLINSSTLLHSERITPPPPADEEVESEGGQGQQEVENKGGGDQTGEAGQNGKGEGKDKEKDKGKSKGEEKGKGEGKGEGEGKREKKGKGQKKGKQDKSKRDD